MADVMPDAMSTRIPLLLALGAVGSEDQEPNLVSLQSGKGMVLINFGLSCGQGSCMSTQTTSLGCHKTSFPQPGSSRIIHGMSSAGQIPSQGAAHLPAERSVCVLWGAGQVRRW